MEPLPFWHLRMPPQTSTESGDSSLLLRKIQHLCGFKLPATRDEREKYWYRHRDEIEQVVYEMPPSKRRIIDVTYARRQAQSLSHAIFELQSSLHITLEKHELTIHNRWKKKSTDQRSAILVEAWPEISKCHRPEFEDFRKRCDAWRHGRPTSRDPFQISSQFKHINLEDLKYPAHHFLLFLKSRGRNLPGVFAYEDKRTDDAIRDIMWIRDRLDDHTMLLTDQDTPELYGKIYSWDTCPEALEWLKLDKGVLPVDGIAIMGAQKHMLQFLRKAVDLILRNPKGAATLSEDWKPEPCIVASKPSPWPMLDDILTEAPYRAPDYRSFAQISALVNARKSAAQDHLWSLREDPSYFKAHIIDHSEHRIERVHDPQGQAHHSLQDKSSRGLGSRSFWDRVLKMALLLAHKQLWSWRQLAAQLNALPQGNAKSQLRPGQHYTWSPAEIAAVHKCRSLLIAMQRDLILTTMDILAGSTALRPYHIRSASSSSALEVNTNDIKIEAPVIHPISFLLCALLSQRFSRHVGIQNIAYELQHYVNGDIGDNKQQVSPLAIAYLGDLALIGGLSRQIEPYEQYGVQAGDLMTHLMTREDHDNIWQPLRAFTVKLETARFGEDAFARMRNFYYPSDKTRSKENTETMREAERKLDMFWEGFDRHFNNRYDSLKPHNFLPDRQLMRTPEWVEPVAIIKQPTMSNYDTADLAAAVEHRLQLERATESTIEPDSPAKPVEKRKTRGVERRQPQTTDPAVEKCESPDGPPLPQMSNKSWKHVKKISETLFPSPLAHYSAPPGDIPWKDFLKFMSKMNFSIQKQDRSAWHFTPMNLVPQPSILFHEPHPDPGIPYQVARAMSGRLTHAYGWTYETFAAKGDGDQGGNSSDENKENQKGS